MKGKIACITGILGGLFVGFFMMAVALNHNPQGEFYEQGVTHWGHLLSLGLAWCGVTFLVLFTALYVVLAVIQGIAHLLKKR